MVRNSLSECRQNTRNQRLLGWRSFSPHVSDIRFFESQSDANFVPFFGSSGPKPGPAGGLQGKKCLSHGQPRWKFRRPEKPGTKIPENVQIFRHTRKPDVLPTKVGAEALVLRRVQEVAALHVFAEALLLHLVAVSVGRAGRAALQASVCGVADVGLASGDRQIGQVRLVRVHRKLP